MGDPHILPIMIKPSLVKLAEPTELNIRHNIIDEKYCTDPETKKQKQQRIANDKMHLSWGTKHRYII